MTTKLKHFLSELHSRRIIYRDYTQTDYKTYKVTDQFKIQYIGYPTYHVTGIQLLSNDTAVFYFNIANTVTITDNDFDKLTDFHINYNMQWIIDKIYSEVGGTAIPETPKAGMSIKDYEPYGIQNTIKSEVLIKDEQLEKRLTAIETSFGVLAMTINDVDKKVNNLDTVIDDIDDRVCNIENSILEFMNSCEGIYNKMKSLGLVK